MIQSTEAAMPPGACFKEVINSNLLASVFLFSVACDCRSVVGQIALPHETRHLADIDRMLDRHCGRSCPEDLEFLRAFISLAGRFAQCHAIIGLRSFGLSG